jgi:serine/threonine protein phosphatase PrpC
MSPGWQAFTLPKSGNADTENEDAFAIEASRAAVCDGASEGWSSGAWARHLAKALVSAQVTPDQFDTWLSATRTDMKSPTLAVSWYAEEKQALGAFSTILGFNLSPDGTKYKACACGDSTLVHLRGDAVIARFPIEASRQFSNRPALIGSTSESGAPSVEWFAGRAEPGDSFYLMTDALAEWFLREFETGERPWERVNAVTSAVDAAAEFAGWIQLLRGRKELKNDDVTLIRVRIA